MGTEDGEVHDAVTIVLLVNLALLTPPVLVLYYPEYTLTPRAGLSFIGAGLAGTLFGRLLNFSSIKRIGASRTAPIVATWALISSVLGVLLLGETLTAVHLLGIVFVVGGVGTITWETGYENPDNLSRRRLDIGLLVPLGAAFFFGLEPILAKVGFAEGTPAPVGLVVKTFVATTGFVLYLYFADKLPQREQFSGRSFRWFGLAGIAGTVFLLGYYLSLAIAPVNVTVPIIVANPLFVVVLSALFMPDRLEQVTWTLLVAATLIVVGILLVTVSG